MIKISFFFVIKKITQSFKKDFSKIKFVDIKLTSSYLKKINQKKFIIDKNTCSIFFESIIKKKNKILDLQDPIYNFKKIKNKKEIENIKKAHFYDGVALTKYLIWLKKFL